MSRFIMPQGESKPRFRVGSRAFFEGMEGFEPSDLDEVEFEENPKLYKNVMQFRAKDKSRCLFKWRRMSPDEFVDYTLHSKLPMEMGKFLVPEVADYLGITIEHLQKLRPVADLLDGKHTYEKIIFDSYLSNGGFFLSGEQRDLAFAAYRNARKS